MNGGTGPPVATSQPPTQPWHLGRDDTSRLTVDGELTPLTVPRDLARLIASGLQQRAEISAAEAQREIFARQVKLYRRARVPNPSLVFYAQSDGFSERVLGGGLAFPITLPSPLGRAYAGEIAEAKARTRQATAQVEAWHRQVRTDVITAYHKFLSREAELALFSKDRRDRVEAHLEALVEALSTGRLPIREIVLVQQQLLEFLEADIETREALAVASVELAHAAGLLPGAALQ